MLVLAILFTKGSADIARFFEPQRPRGRVPCVFWWPARWCRVRAHNRFL